MDTLPQLPRSSSSYFWGQDAHVDVSVYDGRSSISESQTLPRGFDYSPSMNMAYGHAGSQEYFAGPPLIDTRAWETLFYHPSENFSRNSPSAPNHWQYSYSPPAGRECPTSDNYMDESTQSEWTTTPVDAHPPHTPFALGPPFPSVPSESHVSPSVDDRELHHEHRASDVEVFYCPLPSSDGTYCNAPIPCNEARITAHLRSIHALHAKRFEVISCLWPGCKCSMQAASIPRHIITLHVKTRFQCSYCGKSLTRKDGKLKHEKICHEKP
ncbi:hypothetical protein BDR06DRAFT_1009555 [Suillus hirtellus]|nr:hypothetical protein BDR06DRAFT_1009555 [Suillus hirtellus]